MAPHAFVFFNNLNRILKPYILSSSPNWRAILWVELSFKLSLQFFCEPTFDIKYYRFHLNCHTVCNCHNQVSRLKDVESLSTFNLFSLYVHFYHSFQCPTLFVFYKTSQNDICSVFHHGLLTHFFNICHTKKPTTTNIEHPRKLCSPFEALMEADF